MDNVWQELRKIASPNNFKYQYFLFKNKIPAGGDVEYKDMSKEEFMQKYGLTEHSLKFYMKWERSEEYQRLMLIYLKDNMTDDLQKTYAKVKENAIKGDEKSIKLMILLQDEITKRLKEFNKAKQEDEAKKEKAKTDLEDNENEDDDDGLVLS